MSLSKYDDESNLHSTYFVTSIHRFVSSIDLVRKIFICIFCNFPFRLVSLEYSEIQKHSKESAFKHMDFKTFKVVVGVVVPLRFSLETDNITLACF